MSHCLSVCSKCPVNLSTLLALRSLILQPEIGQNGKVVACPGQLLNVALRCKFMSLVITSFWVYLHLSCTYNDRLAKARPIICFPLFNQHRPLRSCTKLNDLLLFPVLFPYFVSWRNNFTDVRLL